MTNKCRKVTLSIILLDTVDPLAGFSAGFN